MIAAIGASARSRTPHVPATVAGALAGLALGLPVAMLPHAARDACLLAPFLLAAAIDLRTRRIPNALSAAALALALTSAVLSGSAGEAFTGALAALVTGVALMFAARGGFGAGDAKLMAAAGAVAGWSRLLTFLLAMSLAGGVAAAVLLAVRRQRGTTMPYGPAIAVAVAIILATAG